MWRTDLPVELQTLVNGSRYAVLATTCPDGTAWNSPLAVAFDSAINMYWASASSSRHSRNLETNPYSFAVIIGSAGSPLEGKGLYMRMRARVLCTKNEVSEALLHYDAGLFRKYRPTISFLGSCPTRLYKAEALELWTNQDLIKDGYFIDTRKHLFW